MCDIALYCPVLHGIAWFLDALGLGLVLWVIGSFSFFKLFKNLVLVPVCPCLPLFVLSACPVGPVASTDEGTLKEVLADLKKT